MLTRRGVDPAGCRSGRIGVLYRLYRIHLQRIQLPLPRPPLRQPIGRQTRQPLSALVSDQPSAPQALQVSQRPAIRQRPAVRSPRPRLSKSDQPVGPPPLTRVARGGVMGMLKLWMDKMWMNETGIDQDQKKGPCGPWNKRERSRNSALGGIGIEGVAVQPARQQRAGDRRQPEQPQLTHGLTTDPEGHAGAAGGIHRSVGDRDADQVDQH